MQHTQSDPSPAERLAEVLTRAHAAVLSKQHNIGPTEVFEQLFAGRTSDRQEAKAPKFAVAAAIERGRAALLARQYGRLEQVEQQHTERTTERQVQTPTQYVDSDITARPTASDLAMVKVVAPSPLADFGVCLSAALGVGPRRLLELLQRLGIDLCRVRQYPVMPSQIVMHQSQELLAAALGVHRVTVWRWASELEALGLIQARAHKGTTRHRGAAVTRNDGSLYAVALKVGYRARLRYEDLKHQYRDLDADRRAGKTAYQTLQQSSTKQENDWYKTLRNWAVSPGNTNTTPVVLDDCCTSLNTVQDVVANLHLVATCHPTKRAALVGMLGAALARDLRDPHSRRWYCGVIWQTWRAEVEGHGTLQGLGAQLARLAADCVEWPDLRCPGALLASRLR